MNFEFRWYCQNQPVVISISVQAEDEDQAATLAAQAIHDIARGAERKWEWKPGVRILSTS